MKEYEKIEYKYQNRIITPEKDIVEIMQYLKNKVDYRIVDLTKYEHRLNRIKHNIYYSYYNDSKSINKDDLIIEGWEIIKNKKSINYYSNHDVRSHDDTIYVVFEYKTGYISSNSNDVLSELIVKRGINSEDIAQKSIVYKNYLFFLEYAIENNLIIE